MSDNEKWNPISINVNPRLKSKVRQEKKHYGFFSTNFMFSTSVVVLFFLALFIPNFLGFEGFFGSQDNVDLTAFKVDSSTVVVDGLIGEGEYVSEYIDPDNGIKIYAEHNGSYLFIGIECQREGWCAIGFNDQGSTQAMVGADIKMGRVFENGTSIVDDRYASSLSSPVLDESKDDSAVDNIVDFSGSQGGTDGDYHTVIEMVLEIGTGDSVDKVLKVGNLYRLIYAQTDEDNLKTIHLEKSKITFLISIDSNT